VNGIDITEYDNIDDQIRLIITSPFVWVRKPVGVFRVVAAARQYRVCVNGVEIGTFGEKRLTAGIPVPVPGLASQSGG
jgi:hypothetical protein